MKQNKIVLVIGKKGSGKSHLVKNTLLRYSEPYIVIDTLGEYDHGLICHDFQSAVKFISSGKFSRLICRFTDDEDIESLFHACFEMNSHTLIVEEINRYCNVHSISDGLNKLIRYGRHKEINIVGITQRPFDLPKIILSLTDDIFCFQLIEPRDIEYLVKITNATKLTKVNTLNVGSYIHIQL